MLVGDKEHLLGIAPLMIENKNIKFMRNVHSYHFDFPLGPLRFFLSEKYPLQATVFITSNKQREEPKLNFHRKNQEQKKDMVRFEG